MNIKSKYFWISATTLLVFASLFFIVKIKTELSGFNRQFPENTISVSGEGKIFVKPDIAKISAGIVKKNRDFIIAQKEATEIINKTINFLKSKGVDEKDIKTTNYNIYPQYDYTKGESRFSGYEVSQNLEIKIRDLDKVGEILVGLTKSGTNTIGSLVFDVDDIDTTKTKARDLAIKNAKIKARELSKSLGVRLSKIVSFSESGGLSPIYFGREASLGVGGDFSALPPSVPVGENEIIANVTITYEIR